MKRLIYLTLTTLIALAAVSCSKHANEGNDPFKGVWYVNTIYESGKEEVLLEQGTGETYWEFKNNGTVLIHDTTIPELGGGSTPKPFSYQAASRILTVDNYFTYEVLGANSSVLRLKSQFSPEVWDRDSYLIISFLRNKKGLGN